jgi:hypothetical protein
LALAFATPSAAFEITATSPASYALDVHPPLGTIEVTFDAPVPLPPAAAMRVAGTMSGLHSGSLEVLGNRLRWHPGPKPFLPGEMVNVNLRSDVHGTGGGALAGGRYFAFTFHSRRCVPDWSSVTTYGTATVPYFIHGGDLDGDGRPDLAVPNEDSDDVSIFRNATGNGSFPAHTEYGVGNRPSSIFGEDFDNDGDQDLATADIFSGTVTVLRNRGNGSFSAGLSYPAGITTRQVHGGDFDGDNDVDLCATSRSTNEVYLFYNNGDGTFAGTAYGPVRGGPFAIRCADLNGDRRIDIAVACQDADSLEVLLNTGSGFVTGGRWPIGNGPWCLNGNDLDGDGDFDLVSVASFANRLVLLRNDGTGKFPSPASWPTGSFPLGVFAADLDGDGDIDVTSSNYTGASAGVYLNDGTGTLSLSATLPTTSAGSYAWAHDLDGDGDLDLSVVDEEANELFVFLNGGTATDVDGAAARRPAWGASLSVAPNPLRAGPGARITLASTIAPLDVAPALDIYDVAGRHLRRIAAGEHSGPAVKFDWDGTDAAGRPVAAGRYLAVVVAGGRRFTAAATIAR